MLKLSVCLTCLMFFSAAVFAQDPSGEQPKGQNQSRSDTQSNTSSGEQPKGQSASGTSDQSNGATQQSARDVSPAGQTANAPVNTTVRGCVQAGERVTLTDSTGNIFLLQGDTSAIKGQQHKVVEVSGRQLPPDSRQSSAAIPSIEVKTMRQIADSCHVNIYPRTQPPAGNARQSQPNPSTTPYSGPREGPQSEKGGPPDAVINSTGAGGAPSPGTGNTTPPPQTPPR